MARLRQSRVRGTTKILANNRVTLPVAVLRRVGLKPGDLIAFRSLGPGRITVTRAKT